MPFNLIIDRTLIKQLILFLDFSWNYKFSKFKLLEVNLNYTTRISVTSAWWKEVQPTNIYTWNCSDRFTTAVKSTWIELKHEMFSECERQISWISSMTFNCISFEKTFHVFWEHWHKTLHLIANRCYLD